MEEPPRDIFRLSHDWLSVQEVVDSVSSSRCGAVSVFIGATREDQAEGRKVIGLQYEAYEAMVQSELSRLAGALRARWPSLLHVCIHHRLGWVKVGEASVVMAISSPHRQDGQAIQHAVTQLKASAPIWKKEVYDTHQSSWKENSECSWSQGEELLTDP
ncbi:molybdopterin synthase catalytic subunit-like [Poeciliopsis prolifica]|uniref:molybdopterin synthase catalytic subunit-like n=1 Tax=Poeciliopsis prolifica TaxID=188132 RepID=UPI0024140B59|nr:molybdopterin synthase catalytic subunit-like [Poeciliopsis prolifica]